MKYRHKKTGDIATKIEGTESSIFYNSHKFGVVDRGLIEDSCDWEKVEENPWKVTKLSSAWDYYFLASDGYYSHNKNSIIGNLTLENVIGYGFKIDTVSNGKEEFSVGEYVEYFEDGDLHSAADIKSFKLLPNTGRISLTLERSGNETIFTLGDTWTIKKKPVLYTTEDGVKRYEYQKEWWIIKDVFWRFTVYASCITKERDIENSKARATWKIFSTKEAAEKWMDKENSKLYEMNESKYKPGTKVLEIITNITYTKGSSGYWSDGISDSYCIPDTMIDVPDSRFKLLEKKIIGYKVPTTLYGGTILKGTVYSKNKPSHSFYTPGGRSDFNGQMIPAEIVETWEPAYEEEKKERIIKIGTSLSGKSTDVKVSPENVEVRGEKISIEKIKEIYKQYDTMHRINNKWDVRINKDIRCINIGCENEANRFSLSDIDSIIAAWEVLTEN